MARKCKAGCGHRYTEVRVKDGKPPFVHMLLPSPPCPKVLSYSWKH